MLLRKWTIHEARCERKQYVSSLGSMTLVDVHAFLFSVLRHTCHTAQNGQRSRGKIVHLILRFMTVLLLSEGHFKVVLCVMHIGAMCNSTERNHAWVGKWVGCTLHADVVAQSHICVTYSLHLISLTLYTRFSFGENVPLKDICPRTSFAIPRCDILGVCIPSSLSI